MLNERHNERKQEILAKSPYLRTFLEYPLQIEQPLIWGKNIQLTQREIFTQIKTKWGKDWEERFAEPQYLRGLDLGVFDTQLDEDLSLALVSSNIGFGFEVASRADVGLFVPSIIRIMVLDQNINPDLVGVNGNVSGILTSYVTDLLHQGVSLATINPEHTIQGNVNTNPIDTFLEDLDITDL